MPPGRPLEAFPPSVRRARLPRAAAIGGVMLACAALSCGRERASDSTELSFEQLSDTAGLARGRPLLTALEPHRLGGGAMRVRGTIGFPDGTRVQITVAHARSGATVRVLQATVEDGVFETAPFMGERGPLAEDDYRFELLAHFNDAWQPADVLNTTDQGRRLRGPGITRSAMGQATYRVREERRL